MAKKNKTAAAAPEKRKIPLWMVISFGAVLALVIVALVPELAGPPLGEEAGIRNLVVFTFDTTRADRIGCYGYPKARTQNTDRLAKEGVLFNRCISVAPITLPSHASILTGLYPYSHGVRNNGTHNMDPEVLTMAEILDAEGFATGAVVSAFVLDSRHGLDQGFHSYDDDLAAADKAPLFMYKETKAQNTADRAVRWLQDRGSERFFLWVHFFDPHANYDPPEPFLEQTENPYDGEISYSDAGMGNVLEALRRRGILGETLVVMTSDHGESLGEHGEQTHSLFIYDATTWVPLVMSHPALVQGKRIQDTVSGVDIVPTALELLGFEVPAGLDGVSHARALVSPKAQVEQRSVYAESMNPYYNHGWSDLRAVRDNRFRYIRAPKPELYDLLRDGRERNNIHDTSPEVVTAKQGQLEMWLAGGEKDTRGSDIRSMSPEQREALAELGYVWSEDDSLPEPGADLPDPKDKVKMWERSQRAHDLVRQQRLPEAESALKQVLEEDPNATLTQSALVGVLLKLGKRDEAYEVLRRLVGGPAPPVTSILRLAALEHADEIPTWEQHLERAKQIAPKDPLPWVRQGDWAQEDGDNDAALTAYEQALVVDPQCAQAYIGIGNTLHRAGDDVASEDALRKATEIDPQAIEAFYNLGVVTEALERPADAQRWYLRALAIDEKHVLTLVNLANLYYSHGQSKNAEVLYKKAVEARPEDFNANFNLGILYLKTAAALEGEERKERAVLAAGAFANAAGARSDRPAAVRNRMVACRWAEDNEGMAQCAAAILESEPESLDALVFLAVARERLGQAAEAESAARKAWGLDPGLMRERGGKDEEWGRLLARLGLIEAPPVEQAGR